MSSGKLVACLLNARGDHLLNLPALRALSRVACGRLVLVVRRGAAATFLRDVAAAAVVELDATYETGGYRFDAPLAARAVLAHGPVETLVSLNPWNSPALEDLVGALRPQRSVGLGEGPWTHPVALDFGCHSSELAFRTAQALGAHLELRDFSDPPAYPPAARRFARELRDELPGGPLLVVHRETKRDKQWPDARWAQALSEWTCRHPEGLAVDLGLQAFGDEEAALLSDRVLHGLRLPLDHALALVGVADVFAGIDSCFLHAADLARVPGVGLFFSTSAHEFGMRWSEHRHLSVSAPAELEAATVVSAIESLPARPVTGRATGPGTRAFVAARPGNPAFRVAGGLALGTVGLGTARFTFERDLTVAEVFERALEAGCNVVDLAGNHGGGDACALVGDGLRRALRHGAVEREQLFLCGKAGFTEHLAGSPLAHAHGWDAREHCLAPDYLRWEVERQCRWLGVTTLDAFLLQNPEELVAEKGAGAWPALDEAFELLEALFASGRIGSYGVSTAEALRVPRGDPRHLDLAALHAAARRAGGARHGFRVLELPVSVTRLEALDVPAHRAPDGDGEDLPALEWARRAGMTVLASTPLNGGRQLAAVAGATYEATGLGDPAASLLQVARSVPGVTCALAGVSNPAHLASVEALAGRPPLDLTAPASR